MRKIPELPYVGSRRGEGGNLVTSTEQQDGEPTDYAAREENVPGST